MSTSCYVSPVLEVVLLLANFSITFLHHEFLSSSSSQSSLLLITRPTFFPFWHKKREVSSLEDEVITRKISSLSSSNITTLRLFYLWEFESRCKSCSSWTRKGGGDNTLRICAWTKEIGHRKFRSLHASRHKKWNELDTNHQLLLFLDDHFLDIKKWEWDLRKGN